jgi:hypothetical protein
MFSSQKEKVELVVIENNTEYLLRRYKISRNTLYYWRKYLGLSMSNNKRFFDNDEVLELDYFFAAAHVPQRRRSKFWGLQMGKEMYAQYILDKGITLDDYLIQKFGINYEEFLCQARVKYGKKLFGN